MERGEATFEVASDGMASILIDAPLEEIVDEIQISLKFQARGGNVTPDRSVFRFDGPRLTPRVPVASLGLRTVAGVARR